MKRVRKPFLLKLLVIASFLSNPLVFLYASKSSQKKIKRVKVATIKTDKGKLKIYEDTRLSLPFYLGVKTKNINHKCRKQTALTKIENKLELNHMIKILKEMKNPKLTKIQKRVLRKIPACKDYTLDISLISHLLSGHKILKLAYETIKS